MQSPYQPTPVDNVANHIFKTSIPGLFYLEQVNQIDERGFFTEISILEDLNQVLSEPFIIKQINQAHSQKNVIRGFHAEQWRKLVWVAHGQVFSALVDLRPGSPSYKQTEIFILGSDDHGVSGGLFIDTGIGNSVCVTAGPVDYVYCVDSLYRDRNKNGDLPISLFDPTLNISWPISREAMIISERDKNGKNLI